MREYATLVPLVLLAFWIGIYPKPLFTVLDQPVRQIMAQVNPDYYKTAGITAPQNAQPAAAAVRAPGAPGAPAPGAQRGHETAAASAEALGSKYLALASSAAANVLAGGKR
jgi:NADH-quinone oxidoreductase subunit M